MRTLISRIWLAVFFFHLGLELDREEGGAGYCIIPDWEIASGLLIGFALSPKNTLTGSDFTPLSRKAKKESIDYFRPSRDRLAF